MAGASPRPFCSATMIQIAQVDEGQSREEARTLGVESGNSVGWLALSAGDMSPDPRDEIAEAVHYGCMTPNEAEAKLKDLGLPPLPPQPMAVVDPSCGADAHRPERNAL